MDKKKIIKLITGFGFGLSLAVLGWIYGPNLFIETRYHQQKSQAIQLAAGGGKPMVGFRSMIGSLAGGFKELTKQDDLMVPVSAEFGLIIPKIFANVAVTENVNPEDPTIYQAVLKQAGGVAHASGTSLPGEPGTIYIFGHSTDASINVERFNAMFYLLKNLEAGDLIIAYYNNQPYRYRVKEKKIVEPSDLTDILNVENKERLVLQTCWPPGTSWRRLLIIAEPEQN